MQESIRENNQGSNQGNTKEILSLQNAIISLVADLVEFRGYSTGLHIGRTQNYVRAFVDQLLSDGIYPDEMSDWDPDAIVPSAQLHDLGKIYISDSILNKTGVLTPEEFEIMKTHAQRGAEAITRIENLGDYSRFIFHARAFAGTHHERWDGAGYPHGMSGLEIPLEGRIMAIVDVYDALVSDRPYKRAFHTEEAARIIIDGAGSHFDPVLVSTFDKLADEFATIAGSYRAWT